MAKKFKDTNAYTLIFAVLMVIIVGSVLAFTANSLKPIIDANKVIEKKKNILQSLGLDVTAANADTLYSQHIKEAVTLDANGKKVEGNGFTINLVKEVKKPINEQLLPLYVAEKEGQSFYVIPLRGNGLWGPIWGYISLKKDLTVQGVVFDHSSETPGLGAEITEDSFTSSFVGEHILTPSGQFKGIKVLKGNQDPTNSDKTDNEVDAITGATITGNGVGDMIYNRLKLYQPFLTKSN